MRFYSNCELMVLFHCSNWIWKCVGLVWALGSCCSAETVTVATTVKLLHRQPSVKFIRQMPPLYSWVLNISVSVVWLWVSVLVFRCDMKIATSVTPVGSGHFLFVHFQFYDSTNSFVLLFKKKKLYPKRSLSVFVGIMHCSDDWSRMLPYTTHSCVW